MQSLRPIHIPTTTEACRQFKIDIPRDACIVTLDKEMLIVQGSWAAMEAGEPGGVATIECITQTGDMQSPNGDLWTWADYVGAFVMQGITLFAYRVDAMLD